MWNNDTEVPLNSSNDYDALVRLAAAALSQSGMTADGAVRLAKKSLQEIKKVLQG